MESSSVNSRFVDAAFSGAGAEALCYTHGDMKALIQKHFLSLLRDFPSLSPSVDPFTQHRDGTTVNLLNAQGFLPTSTATDSSDVLVTLWVPQNYPFAPPTVYVFPAAPSARLLPDHPFVDRSTGLTTPPYADTWRYPLSDLSGLARDLAEILTLCPPCGGANVEAERDREEEEVTGPLVTRLCRDAAGFRAKAEEDIERLWAEQAVLRGRARAVDAAMEELGEEREGLERAVARKVRDTRVITEWLGSVCSGANDQLSDGEGFEEGDEASRRLVANAAAELAIDDAVDALAVALEKGLVGVKVYLKQEENRGDVGEDNEGEGDTTNESEEDVGDGEAVRLRGDEAANREGAAATGRGLKGIFDIKKFQLTES